MKYCFATALDLPKLTEFIDGTDYFFPVDVTTLGGHWLLAKTDEKIYGALWFFTEPPQMFIGYWAASNSMVAVKMAFHLEGWAKKQDIKYVHGVISHDNANAVRLAVKGCGMLAGEMYYRVYKEIQSSGTEKDRTTDNYTVADRARTVAS